MQSYDLTLATEEDLRGIWRYTYETWGFEQAETYFARIEACFEAVGNRRAQSKAFEGLPDSLRIHICEHHYIIWLDEERPVIIAILHERMDFMRWLKNRL